MDMQLPDSYIEVYTRFLNLCPVSPGKRVEVSLAEPFFYPLCIYMNYSKEILFNLYT